MKNVFEIVSYSLSDDQKEQEFLRASHKVQNEALPKIEGFMGRKILKNANGIFCDIVMWKSMEDAQNALEAVMKSEVCLAMFSFIHQKSIQMSHFNILSSSHINLDFSAGAVEIGTVSLNNIHQWKEVIQNAENVRKKYLQNQEGFVAQFLIQKEDGTYGDVVFNKNDVKESEQICKGYFTDETCQKYLSYFKSETTDLQYWKVL
jgi:hypothetical protein